VGRAELTEPTDNGKTLCSRHACTGESQGLDQVCGKEEAVAKYNMRGDALADRPCEPTKAPL
jgi:hypothetical protein